ncbi:MAG: hypothetical protein K6F63_04055 [Lachnospiraceae bacterium]|nr:hypothetical protein [Lachnospiraceae bacterium]
MWAVTTVSIEASRRVMAREFKFKGYTFYSEEEYNEAKKENETIEYIKARTDLTNTETVVALYNKMIDRKVITTVIGLDFLKRLRGLALKNEMINESKLRELPEVNVSKKKKEKQPLTTVQKLRRENLGLKIVIIGLAAIIVGMFVIVLTGKSSPLKSVYERDIINKYSGWQQELDEMQQKINDQLYFLEQNGIYYEK